jgi:hypothetical protein
VFFFEKNNQKTFVCWYPRPLFSRGYAVIFPKKDSLPIRASYAIVKAVPYVGSRQSLHNLFEIEKGWPGPTLFGSV